MDAEEQQERPRHKLWRAISEERHDGGGWVGGADLLDARKDRD